jgi:hypothetical protein
MEKRKRGSVEQAAAWGDLTKLESRGDGIDESAPTDAARFDVPEHMAVELVVSKSHRADGTAGRTHAVSDARALEGGSGSGRCAEETVAVAEDDFAVRAQVNEGDELITFMEAGGEDAGEEIAANESTEGGEEADGGITGQFPSERGGGEFLEFKGDRFERAVAEGFDVKTGEQVVHDGIPDDDDVLELSGEILKREEEFGNELAELTADEQGQQSGLASLDGKLDPAHDVGAVPGLGVKGGADGQDMAGGQVDQLGDYTRGAEIDHDTQTRLRDEWKG